MSEAVPVVPRPVREAPGEGVFALSNAVRVAVADDPALVGAGTVWADALSRQGGGDVGLVVGTDRGDGVVQLVLDEALPADGAYRLVVAPRRVTVTAGSTDGLAPALATVRQRLRRGPGGVAELPVGEVEDAPHHGWRGLEVRGPWSALGLRSLCLLVDVLALYKLDVLGLPLRGPEGWRLRLRGTDAPAGALGPGEWTSLVAYADVRGVAVVPGLVVPAGPEGPRRPADALGAVLAELVPMSPAAFVHLRAAGTGADPAGGAAARVAEAATAVVSAGRLPLVAPQPVGTGLPEGTLLLLDTLTAGQDARAAAVAAAREGTGVVLGRGPAPAAGG
ncbi:glycoside hydrolase family 20 zincin-like fold domain-containing protein, partial [Cellulomonas endophytica]|uniref:glycoside hydrolase family 20 zincin-like fold domain-containing protein n=1 Tax=Cellulomonas endophytica TaxID=2494735 RepID=UPI0023EA5B6C